MQIASMTTRQAAAALADAGAPGGRSGEEYLMWCAALRQERADKHTALMTPGVEQHRAVVRVGAAWVRVLAGRTVDAGVAPDFDHVLAGRTVDAVTGLVAAGGLDVRACGTVDAVAGRVAAGGLDIRACGTVDAGVAPGFDRALAGRTVDAVTGFVADGRVWRTRTESCSNQGVTSEFSHQVLLPPPLSATTCQQGYGLRGANGIGRATQTHTRG